MSKRGRKKKKKPGWLRKAADNSALNFAFGGNPNYYRDSGDRGGNRDYRPRLIMGWPADTDFSPDNLSI
jgi:hypothetical protein